MFNSVLLMTLIIQLFALYATLTIFITAAKISVNLVGWLSLTVCYAIKMVVTNAANA